MAKRRIVRQESSEEEEPKEEKKRPAFKPPEFDETEFLQTENKSAKLIYISLATALVAGIVTFGLMTLLHYSGLGNKFTIPLIVPFIFAGIAVYLFRRFGIEIRNLEWKKWLENGFMFVLAWFAVWLVSMNPPFSDFGKPMVSDPLIEIEMGSDQVIHYVGDRMFVDDVEQTKIERISDLEDIDTIKVYATITDNWNLDEVKVTLQYNSNNTWIDLEMGLSMNISIGRSRDDLTIDDNVSDELDNLWPIHDDDVRKDHMYLVSLRIQNQTQLDLSNGVSFRIVYTASDTRGNDQRREFEFRVRS